MGKIVCPPPARLLYCGSERQGPGNRTLFGNGSHLQMGLSAGSEMRLSWMRVAPNPGTGVLTRDGRGETQTDTEEKPRGDGGRDGRDPATCPGPPAAPRAGRGRKEPPPEPVEGAGPAPPGPQTSELKKTHSCCLHHCVCGFCYVSPQKPILTSIRSLSTCQDMSPTGVDTQQRGTGRREVPSHTGTSVCLSTAWT